MSTMDRKIVTSLISHSHSSFSKMNLANLQNLAKMLTFYTNYFKLSLECSQYRIKAFYNEIKALIVKFLILTEFGKLGKFS